ncbi:hypothetical protein B9Z55_017409 [Caenorhabditis nigoni]|uniref:DUF38 domain-containing protein n=1 Tax=Caenorhabditis nigoni TaxID=1611254 RepID=A0A2G5T9V0_9PELO|nr:hypothetical protein B9Z55_017409 [Caenorhabditis nigoni]
MPRPENGHISIPSTSPNSVIQQMLQNLTNPPQIPPAPNPVNHLDQSWSGNRINHGNSLHWQLSNDTRPPANLPYLANPSQSLNPPLALADPSAQSLESPLYPNVKLPPVPKLPINDVRTNEPSMNGFYLPERRNSLFPHLSNDAIPSGTPPHLTNSRLWLNPPSDFAVLPDQSLQTPTFSSFELPPDLNFAINGGQKNGEHKNDVNSPATINSFFPDLKKVTEPDLWAKKELPISTLVQKFKPASVSNFELSPALISATNGQGLWDNGTMGQKHGGLMNGISPELMKLFIQNENNASAPHHHANPQASAGLPARNLPHSPVFELSPAKISATNENREWDNGTMGQRNGGSMDGISPELMKLLHQHQHKMPEAEHLATALHLANQQSSVAPKVKRYQRQQLEKVPSAVHKPQKRPRGRPKNTTTTAGVVNDSPNYYISTIPIPTEEATHNTRTPPFENTVHRRQIAEPSPDPISDRSFNGFSRIASLLDRQERVSFHGSIVHGTPIRAGNGSRKRRMAEIGAEVNDGFRSSIAHSRSIQDRRQVHGKEEDEGLERKEDEEQVEKIEWVDGGRYEMLSREVESGQRAVTMDLESHLKLEFPLTGESSANRRADQGTFSETLGLSDLSSAFVKFEATSVKLYNAPSSSDSAESVQPYQAMVNFYPQPEASTSSEFNVINKSLLTVDEFPTDPVSSEEDQHQPDSIEVFIRENFVAPAPPNSSFVGKESNSHQVSSFGNGENAAGAGELEHLLQNLSENLEVPHPYFEAKDDDISYDSGDNHISNDNLIEQGSSKGFTEHEEDLAGRSGKLNIEGSFKKGKISDQSSEALNVYDQEMDHQDIEGLDDLLYFVAKNMAEDSRKEVLGQENASRHADAVRAQEEDVMVPEAVEEAENEGDGYFQMDDGVPEAEERVLLDDVEMDDVVEMAEDEAEPEAQEQEEEVVEEDVEEMVPQNGPIVTIVIRNPTVILTVNGIEELEVPALEFEAVLQRLRQVEVIRELVFECDHHLRQLADSIRDAIVESLGNEEFQIPAVRFVYKCSTTGAGLFMELLKRLNPEVLKSVKVENEKFPSCFICDLQVLEQWKNLEALEILPVVPADANEDYFLAIDDFKVTLSSASSYEIISLVEKFRSRAPKSDVLPKFDICTVRPSNFNNLEIPNVLLDIYQNGIRMITGTTLVPENLAVFKFETNRLQGKFVPRNVIEEANDLSIFFD